MAARGPIGPAMPWHTRPTAAAAIARDDDATDAMGKRPGRPPAFLPHDFEAVLPAQWFARPAGSFQPEKRLMLAALTDAIELFIQDPAPGNMRRTMLQQAAAEWIRSNDRRWPFSFPNVCETLGLEPSRLRERLERIREQGRRTPAPDG